MSGRSLGIWAATGAMATACAGAWVVTYRLASAPDDAIQDRGGPSSPGATQSGGAVSAEQLAGIIERIRTLIQEEQREQAAALAERAVDLYPRDRALRTLYAETLELLEDFDKAYAQYAAAIDLGGQDAELEYRAGLAANTAGLRGEARRRLENAVSLDASNGAYALNLGLVLEQMGQLADSEIWLQHARRLSPNAAMAWGMLAEIARRSGRFTEAEAYIERARDLEPRSARWLVIDADLRSRTAPNEALDMLESLDRFQRNDEFTLRVAKKVYGMLGRFEDAAWWLSDASDEDESNAGLAAETAELFERAGDITNALFYARRAVSAGDERSKATVERLERLRGGG